jgi:hypothetical protein
VKESPVQFECIVQQVIETGSSGGAGNLVLCEVVRIHVDEAVLDERGKIDQRKIDLVGRMGGHFYCRAHGDALFELAQPSTQLGVGVDALPTAARNSRILTGNELGQLGTILRIPDETRVNEFKLTELSELFITLHDQPRALEEALHRHAQQLLSKDLVEEAWMTLLAFNDR